MMKQELWHGYDGDSDGTGVVAWQWWELGDSDGTRVVAWL